MATIERFWQEHDKLSLEDFVERFHEPFLLVSEVSEVKKTQPVRFYTTDQGTLTEPMPNVQSPFNMKEKFIFSLEKKADHGSYSAFISIGRAANNDIPLTGGGVSKLHAVLQKTQAGYTLMDSGSRNGTFINGIKLEPQKPAPLRDKDLISFSSQVSARFFLPRTLYIWCKGRPTTPE